MEGIVRAITVANTPTIMIETLMTQIISISEACKEKFHYTLMFALSAALGNEILHVRFNRRSLHVLDLRNFQKCKPIG
jgi:hypothetical protein